MKNLQIFTVLLALFLVRFGYSMGFGWSYSLGAVLGFFVLPYWEAARAKIGSLCFLFFVAGFIILSCFVGALIMGASGINLGIGAVAGISVRSAFEQTRERQKKWEKAIFDEEKPAARESSPLDGS